MPNDFLGPIEIIPPPLIDPFPLKGDFGTGMDFEPPIATHVFDQPGLKTEQRFQLGDGARRFRVHRDHLSCTEYDLLKAHWIQARGLYAEFLYTYTGADQQPVDYRVRYENPNIAFDHMVGLITGWPGLTLVEVGQATPTYTVTAELDRFPDAVFDTALTAQVQKIIPLIRIEDRSGMLAEPLYLSDRRLELDGQLYLPRLVSWNSLSQTLDESSDGTSFQFANADRVWTELVKQVNLYRALVQFSLYHVQTETLVNLWAGFAQGWAFDNDGNFELPVSDGVFELGLAYPSRMTTRSCWKVYKGRYCPSVSAELECPKTWEACNIRGVPKSFGGLIVLPKAVRVKDNSTGVWGFGRSTFTSVTVAQDTVYQRPIQEIYTDIPMVVTCDVAGGRDEGDFYSALGIVGEGPIAGYSQDLFHHRLDGSPPHDPRNYGGWRGIVGNDPAADEDFFALDQAPWVQDVKGWVPTAANLPPTGNRKSDGWVTEDVQHLWVWDGERWIDNGAVTYTAGLAFAEIRRSDEKGLQLSSVRDRAMTVTVTGGIGGWTWTAPGARAWMPKLSNPVWVAVNIYLRAVGLRLDPANEASVPPEMMEAFFDVDAAVASAAVCDRMVPKLVGTGDERQFPFRGALKERKPLKDWLQEIMNGCLGYFTFVNGKLWIGIRFHSGAKSSFTRATILFKSLAIAPVQPKFNWLVGEFGDEEFDWQLNNSSVYDIDQAAVAGKPDSPQYTTSTISLVGVSNKSQAARIVSTRLREELGGVGPQEQRDARNFTFRTTILALAVQVGDIISLDHADFPNDRMEGRVQRWTLNPDYSIDIQASCTTNAMYDLTFGPKPEDVAVVPVPPELLPSPFGLAWMPNKVAPFPDDPLYPDALERTFELWQDYTVTRDGIWDPAIWVSGEFPINQFAETAQPRIVVILMGPAASGVLDGPQTYYATVTERDANGRPTYPSNLSALWFGSSFTDRALELHIVPSSGTWTGYDVWAGLDRRRIGWQFGGSGPVPLTLQIQGPIHPMTQAVPNPSARAVEIAAKHVWHSGIAGVLVKEVPANNQMVSTDFIGSTDNWIGRILTALADQSDGSAPLWNFTVTAFDSATGTLTVFPDCVRALPEDSVQASDVLIVRSIATSATANTVTDTMWDNFVSRTQFNHAGLVPGDEVNRVVRILRGKGAGQYRSIIANTELELTVTPDWDVIPDQTSIVIVEEADWVYTSQSSKLSVSHTGVDVDIRMRVDNLRDRVALVGGFLVDDQGRRSDESFAVYREIYIFGQPPTVRVVGPAEGPWDALPTDHTLRADTSAGLVVIQLPPLYVYQGRPLLVFNDGDGPVRIDAYPDETFYDGSTSIDLTGKGNSVRITAG